MNYMTENKEKKYYTIIQLKSLDQYKKNSIDNAFSNPDTYFSIDKNEMILNKVIHGPRFDSKSKIVPYTYVGSPQIFEIKHQPKFAENLLNLSLKKITTSIIDENYINNNSITKKKNIFSVNDKQIYNLYQKINDRIQSNNVKF